MDTKRPAKTEAAVRVAAGLLEAVRAEMEGQHFYAMAAGACRDPKGREVFSRLAAEELEHARFLDAQRRSVLATGGPDRSIDLGAPMDLSGPSPIFSEEIRSRLRDAHFEMTALSVGAQLELQSKEHYERMASESGDPAVEAFYSDLARWEAGHYRALVSQQEALKEEYWAESGFAPF